MAAKRPIPSSRRKAAQALLGKTVGFLSGNAYAQVPGTERRGPSTLDRLDPTQRFGQKGIERRIAALERNADLVFPDPTDRDGSVIFQAIDELSRAAAISATMPLNERRKARARITTELTRLERALVDAVLPPHG